MKQPKDLDIEKVQVYLEGYSTKLTDVYQDENGYFFPIDIEAGSPSDDGYEIQEKKCYLPDNFQDLDLSKFIN